MSNLIRGCVILVLLLVSAGSVRAQIERSPSLAFPAPPGSASQEQTSPTQLPIQFAQERPQEADARAPQVARQSALEVSARPIEKDEEPLPLPPRSDRRRAADAPAEAAAPGGMLTTVVGSLTVVLLAFFVFVWFTRRAAPQGHAPLPAEVVESLGRAPLAGRQQMQLIRVGKKLVLLSVTAGEARTLTEVTDPAEVDRLAGLCQQSRPGSITSSFRQVLTQSGREAATRNRPAPIESRSREESVPSQFRAAARENRHG